MECLHRDLEGSQVQVTVASYWHNFLKQETNTHLLVSTQEYK